MAEFSIPKAGTICWRELATRDFDKAKHFYGELLGWDLEQSKVTPMTYAEIHIDGKAVGARAGGAGHLDRPARRRHRRGDTPHVIDDEDAAV